MSKTVVFIHPGEIGSRVSGSGIRPQKMLNTFLSLGYSVLTVSGDIKTRKLKYKELKKKVLSGLKIDYVYFESLSRPHSYRIKKIFGMPVPLFSFLDLRFLNWIKSYCPTSYFYRDIHWAFSGALNVSKKKLIFFQVVGRIELYFLRKMNIDFFVPHEKFALYMKTKFKISSKALWPGSDLKIPASNDFSKVKLFYVGGCSPYLYSPLVFLQGMQLAQDIKDLQFTLCTRKKEWDRFNSNLEVPPNTQIVHESGEELLKLYSQSNICVYLSPPSEYLDLTISFKIPEYVCSGRPILCFKGTNVADFVEEHNIGWTVEYNAVAVCNLLKKLNENTSEILTKTSNLQFIKNDLKWTAVVNRLEKNILL